MMMLTVLFISSVLLCILLLYFPLIIDISVIIIITVDAVGVMFIYGVYDYIRNEKGKLIWVLLKSKDMWQHCLLINACSLGHFSLFYSKV